MNKKSRHHQTPLQVVETTTVILLTLPPPPPPIYQLPPTTHTRYPPSVISLPSPLLNFLIHQSPPTKHCTPAPYPTYCHTPTSTTPPSFVYNANILHLHLSCNLLSHTSTYPYSSHSSRYLQLVEFHICPLMLAIHCFVFSQVLNHRRFCNQPLIWLPETLVNHLYLYTEILPLME